MKSSRLRKEMKKKKKKKRSATTFCLPFCLPFPSFFPRSATNQWLRTHSCSSSSILIGDEWKVWATEEGTEDKHCVCFGKRERTSQPLARVLRNRLSKEKRERTALFTEQFATGTDHQWWFTTTSTGSTEQANLLRQKKKRSSWWHSWQQKHSNTATLSYW